MSEETVNDPQDNLETPESHSEGPAEAPADTQPQGTPLALSPVLAAVLRGMPIPIDFSGHGSGWQIQPITEDDGSKSVAGILAMTQGNGLQFYWFREQDLTVFINQAIATHQQMLKHLEKLNPLIVANKAQMQQAISQHEAAQKLIIPGR